MSIETSYEPISPESRVDQVVVGPAPAQSDCPIETTAPSSRRVNPWIWSMRNVALLVLQAMFGGLLMAFGAQVASQLGALAAVLAAVLVAVNAAVLGLIAGAGKLPAGLRILVLAGLILGGTMACTGVALSTYSAAWQALTPFGILVNLELANTAAMLAVTESLRD